MISRYTLPQMGNIWSEQNKFKTWLDVEIAALEAQCEIGSIPKNVVERIKKNVKFDVKKIEEIEFGKGGTGHDLLAFLKNLSEYVKEDLRYIHVGLTSYDIEDTALAIRLKASSDLILKNLNKLSSLLKTLSKKYTITPMIGRTHGVHAEPITFGFKMAVWYQEIKRHIERLYLAKKTISVGKISGAVGTFSNIDTRIEKIVCKKLGLDADLISTQIIQRDRHAYFVTTLALIGASLEKFATEIRNLQRTEILEVEEFFGKTQKGSSAMPHKRNPIISERITGLARVLRGYALTSMETVSLWHERDLTNSSAERIILPDACIALDYIIVKLREVLENLNIYPENMLKNISHTRGLIFSQRVMLKLSEKGLSREKAYEVVQKNAMKSREQGLDFKNLLMQDQEVKTLLTENELNNCFDIKYYLRNIQKVIKRAIQR
ncbi:adenylosuccinate lyase [bacterium Unc6]|nr:adenylosuccinate lyase [bacterium Unc6]